MKTNNIFFLLALITLSSCGSWSNVTKCPTYAYTYRCLDDGDTACTVGPIMFTVGQVFVSPKSGHRCVIISKGCKTIKL